LIECSSSSIDSTNSICASIFWIYASILVRFMMRSYFDFFLYNCFSWQRPERCGSDGNWAHATEPSAEYHGSVSHHRHMLQESRILHVFYATGHVEWRYSYNDRSINGSKPSMRLSEQTHAVANCVHFCNN
jgi:hypothetical protein